MMWEDQPHRDLAARGATRQGCNKFSGIPMEYSNTNSTMSRALDPETASSISGRSAQEIYNDISKALSSCTRSLVEIEFLGKSHPLPPGTNILVDGSNIAISKGKLVQAFLVARQILFNHVKNCPDDKISQLQDATAVILLMDPEHLTAANTRKRLIQRSQKKSGAEFQTILKQELFFVNSYLTSRLHRHTKSPTLWGHRRWLVELSTSTHPKYDVLEDLQSVVLVAAEKHPKNYYAWSHMRWLTCTYTCSTESPNTNNLSRIITITKDWCLKHPNDTSGFSFLLFNLSFSQSLGRGDTELSNMSSAICKDILRLAISFRWTHESLWVFLRTLVAGYGTEHDKIAFHAAIDDLSKVCPESKTLLKRANDWCSRYQQNSSLKP